MFSIESKENQPKYTYFELEQLSTSAEYVIDTKYVVISDLKLVIFGPTTDTHLDIFLKSYKSGEIKDIVDNFIAAPLNSENTIILKLQVREILTGGFIKISSNTNNNKTITLYEESFDFGAEPEDIRKEIEAELTNILEIEAL